MRLYCIKCGKQIYSTGYKLGADIFCSKLCAWKHFIQAYSIQLESFKDELDLKSKDFSAIEVQQSLFNNKAKERGENNE